ncbi:MAG: translation initiation factor [Planctomycetaceae bacterium]
MGLFAGTKWDLPAHCERCGKLEKECRCPEEKAVASTSPAGQTLRVRVEKRKAGRVVTVIAGLESTDPARGDLLTKLKNACGAGGSHEDASLLIQGDHQARVVKLLQETGYRVAR